MHSTEYNQPMPYWRLPIKHCSSISCRFLTSIKLYRNTLCRLKVFCCEMPTIRNLEKMQRSTKNLLFQWGYGTGPCDPYKCWNCSTSSTKQRLKRRNKSLFDNIYLNFLFELSFIGNCILKTLIAFAINISVWKLRQTLENAGSTAISFCVHSMILFISLAAKRAN